MLDDQDEFEAEERCVECDEFLADCNCCWLCGLPDDRCHCEDEIVTDEVKPEPQPEPTPEQLKNLGRNMSRMTQMAHLYFELEEMKRLEPADKQTVIEELAKTLTDEQVREAIMKLQKALCSR